MIATLAVLGLVIDDAVFDLHLPDAEIALEVRAVVLRVPQAELDAREDRERRRRRAVIGHSQLPDFQVLIERDEVASACFDAFVFRADNAVAHAVSAAVFLDLVARGLPRGRPELAALVVTDVDIPPTEIERYIVVAIAADSTKPRVTIK